MTTPTASSASLRVNATLTPLDDGPMVVFDAAPALAEVTPEGLIRLAADSFGDAEGRAGDLADWIAENGSDPDASTVRKALDEVGALETGFVVQLDPDDAARWMVAHRPVVVLADVLERIVSEDEADAPYTSPDERHTLIGQVTSADLARHLGNLFTDPFDEVISELSEQVHALLYRIAFDRGTQIPVIELRGQVGDLLDHAAPISSRADLYRVAGVPVHEARALEADPLRPTDESLMVLAGLLSTPDTSA